MSEFSVKGEPVKALKGSGGKGGILSRKVLGVPMLYVAAFLVLCLAIYAWRAKSTGDVGAEAAAAVPGEGDDEMGGASTQTLYPIQPTGTVYAGQPTNAVMENTPYFGNSEWLRKVVTDMAGKSSTSPGEIQLALQAYLNGDHLTYQQSLIRDEAIKSHGIPPDTFTAGTADGKPVPTPAPVVTPTPAPAPAPVNPVIAPSPAPTPATPRRTHRVVKRDTLWDLAVRYYGNGNRWREISAANGNPNPRALRVGTILVIP